MKAAAWPRSIYLGVGTKEGATPEIQSEMLANMRTLQASLKHQPAVRVHLEVTAGATHGYSAWGQRLPAALRWLLATPPSNNVLKLMAEPPSKFARARMARSSPVTSVFGGHE